MPVCTIRSTEFEQLFIHIKFKKIKLGLSHQNLDGLHQIGNVPPQNDGGSCFLCNLALLHFLGVDKSSCPVEPPVFQATEKVDEVSVATVARWQIGRGRRSKSDTRIRPMEDRYFYTLCLSACKPGLLGQLHNLSKANSGTRNAGAYQPLQPVSSRTMWRGSNRHIKWCVTQ